MKKLLILFCYLIATNYYAISAETKVGEPAPLFELPDYNENIYKLSDYKGNWIILEWINYDCPFVKKHYDSGNMQSLQKEYMSKGVKWFSICSSAPGKQGHFSLDELSKKMREYKTSPTAYLLDETGTTGKSYGAKTTPHIFIINPDGILIYAGAIDDIKSVSTDDIEKANNYVKQVMDAVLSGAESPVKTTQPYGCSVKY